MEVLSYEFMRQAFVACAVVGAAAPLVGAFIVQRGQSLVGDGMGHMAFAGVGLAFLVGVTPLTGALALTLLAAVAIYRLQRGGLSGDLALALLFYGGIALGFLFASRAASGPTAVLSLLFGNPLNLDWGQVATIAGLSLFVAVTVLALYGPLVALAFDEPAARVSGVPTSGLILSLTLLVALVVVGGMAAIGLLLVSAMMVIPVAAAGRLASSYRGMLALAAGLGATSAVGGLLIAFYADVAPGSAIVLTAIGLFALASGLAQVRVAAGRVHR